MKLRGTICRAVTPSLATRQAGSAHEHHQGPAAGHQAFLGKIDVKLREF